MNLLVPVTSDFSHKRFFTSRSSSDLSIAVKRETRNTNSSNFNGISKEAWKTSLPQGVNIFYFVDRTWFAFIETNLRSRDQSTRIESMSSDQKMFNFIHLSIYLRALDTNILSMTLELFKADICIITIVLIIIYMISIMNYYYKEFES